MRYFAAIKHVSLPVYFNANSHEEAKEFAMKLENVQKVFRAALPDDGKSNPRKLQAELVWSAGPT